jgi:hypothetical protein
VLDGAEQVGGAGGAGAQLGHGLAGDGGDVVRHDVEAARGEGGGDEAALVLPGGALGQEQAVADHRVEDAQRGRAAAVVRVVVDQDVADAGRAR